MEEIPIPPSQGIIGDYITNVFENGPWSIWLHVFMLLASAITWPLAFRRAERAFLISLGLLPFALGLGATYIHTLNKYMVWGPQMLHDHTADFAWVVTRPLRFSMLLTLITVVGCLLVRGFRPVRVPPLPRPPSKTYFYRSTSGAVCGPCNESKLRALERIAVISGATPVADAASPDEWIDFAIHPDFQPNSDAPVA